ncbi:IS3 family transposase [Terrisporobacter vanillatitrophus]
MTLKELRALKRELLKQEIQTIYDDSNDRYGAPKIHKLLVKKLM